jgi:hypothetical protein
LINKEKIYFKIKNIMTNSEHKKNDNNFVYVLDRYTNKNIKVLNIDQKTQENIKAGDKIVYSMEDNNQKPSI